MFCTEKEDSVSDSNLLPLMFARMNLVVNGGHGIEWEVNQVDHHIVLCGGIPLVEGSTVQFSLGQGKSITSRSSPLGRPSPKFLTGAPVDKSTHIYEKPYLYSDTLCYPRGKLV